MVRVRPDGLVSGLKGRWARRAGAGVGISSFPSPVHPRDASRQVRSGGGRATAATLCPNNERMASLPGRQVTSRHGSAAGRTNRVGRTGWARLGCANAVGVGSPRITLCACCGRKQTIIQSGDGKGERRCSSARAAAAAAAAAATGADKRPRLLMDACSRLVAGLYRSPLVPGWSKASSPAELDTRDGRRGTLGGRLVLGPGRVIRRRPTRKGAKAWNVPGPGRAYISARWFAM